MQQRRAARYALFAMVQMGKIIAAFAVVPDPAGIGKPVQDRCDLFGVALQEGLAFAEQFLPGKEDMALFRSLYQSMGEAGFDPFFGIRPEAQFAGDLVGFQEAYAPYILGQLVGIEADDLGGLGPVM